MTTVVLANPYLLWISIKDLPAPVFVVAMTCAITANSSDTITKIMPDS